MNQLFLRKLHGAAGLTVAFFILIQSGSGILLCLKTISDADSHAHAAPPAVSHNYDKEQTVDLKQQSGENSADNYHGPENMAVLWQKKSSDLHHGGGFFFGLYRILLGCSLVFMVFSGSTIFYLARKLTKK